MAEEKLGMLIDYEYCTGCHSCEVSCKQRFELDSDEWGIKVAELGPWKFGETDYEWDYIPAPTEICNMCEDRLAAGKKPLCAQHCQAFVIEVGPIEELAKKVSSKKKQVLYSNPSDVQRKTPIF